MTKSTLFRGLLALGVTWGGVLGVVHWAGERMATPEKVVEAIESAEWQDWSGKSGSAMPSDLREERLRKIDEVVAIFGQLDLRERREISGEQELMALFLRLSDEEKGYLVESIFSRHAERIMAIFDQMDPEARERMIERSLREMKSGKGAEILAKLEESDPEIINLVVRKGLRAYFTEASLETKMALLPFMDAVGEMVQGFGKPRAEGL